MIQDYSDQCERLKAQFIAAHKTIAQYSEWTVGQLSSATYSPMIMQFTGCHQAVLRFYWPENAIDLTHNDVIQ